MFARESAQTCGPPMYILENRLNDDECAVADRIRQSREIKDYNLASFFPTNEPACSTEVGKIAACYNNLHYRDGFGIANACVIDDDSDLRLGTRLTHSPHRQQLKTRVFQGGPHLERGAVLPVTEAELIQSAISRDRRPCEENAEFGEHVFTPLIPCLETVVQNPDTIVVPWVWGGENSRAWVRDEDFLEQCGYSKDGRQWSRDRGSGRPKTTKCAF